MGDDSVRLADLLTVQQVADMRKVAVRKVQDWIAKRGMPAHAVGTGRRKVYLVEPDVAKNWQPARRGAKSGADNWRAKKKTQHENATNSSTTKKSGKK